MYRDNPVTGYDKALAAYTADRNLETLTAVCVACAPWNAQALEGLAKVTELLGGMPYNAVAVEWSAEHFDRTYRAAWFPQEILTPILSWMPDTISVRICGTTLRIRTTMSSTPASIGPGTGRGSNSPRPARHWPDGQVSGREGTPKEI
jgi:hypothetical protein